MGSTADKVKGATNEAIGKAKQGVGEAVGSDRLQGEGAIQEIQRQGPAGPGRRQGSGKGRRQQGGCRCEQEPLIDADRFEWRKTGPLGPVFFSCQYQISKSPHPDPPRKRERE